MTKQIKREPWTHIARGPFCYGWGMTPEEAEANARRSIPREHRKAEVEVFEIPKGTECSISHVDGTISWSGEDIRKVRP